MRASAVIAAAILAAALWASACGRGPASAPSSAVAVPATAAPPITATPAAPDDVVVARVDGRPVYGSCVAAQAAQHGGHRRAALDDCVGLELLAGAAAGRGLDRDPDVVDAYRHALVNRFVDREFAARIRTAADLPASLVEPTLEKEGFKMHRPEFRYGVYVRATLPAGTPDGSPKEQAARALIEAVHAELVGRRGLFPSDVFEVGDRLAAARGATVDHDAKPYATSLEGGADRPWREALFQAPEIGAVSPPNRNKWGWDVILWTDVLPARNLTRDQFLTDLFPTLRRRYFMQWSQQLYRDHRVDVDARPLTALVEAERETP